MSLLLVPLNSLLEKQLRLIQQIWSKKLFKLVRNLAQLLLKHVLLGKPLKKSMLVTIGKSYRRHSVPHNSGLLVVRAYSFSKILTHRISVARLEIMSFGMCLTLLYKNTAKRQREHLVMNV